MGDLGKPLIKGLRGAKTPNTGPIQVLATDAKEGAEFHEIMAGADAYFLIPVRIGKFLNIAKTLHSLPIVPISLVYRKSQRETIIDNPQDKIKRKWNFRGK